MENFQIDGKAMQENDIALRRDRNMFCYELFVFVLLDYGHRN